MIQILRSPAVGSARSNKYTKLRGIVLSSCEEQLVSFLGRKIRAGTWTGMIETICAYMDSYYDD